MNIKYIRTKDKIVKHPHPNAEVFTFRYEIVKQADTIKELCDEWICRDNNNIEYRPYRFYFLDDLYAFIKENKLFERYTIYGAIWTDKGLIYVAKMNEKGELELI